MDASIASVQSEKAALRQPFYFAHFMFLGKIASVHPVKKFLGGKTLSITFFYKGHRFPVPFVKIYAQDFLFQSHFFFPENPDVHFLQIRGKNRFHRHMCKNILF